MLSGERNDSGSSHIGNLGRYDSQSRHLRVLYGVEALPDLLQEVFVDRCRDQHDLNVLATILGYSVGVVEST